MVSSRKMICEECSAEMILDDKDLSFSGFYDNYWVCDNCQTSCIEEIRFSRPDREIWHSEANDIVKDYEVVIQNGRRLTINK